ncbi:THAP domain-containing protein [Ooceraea biroi]|uniref:THAP domain-containing protein n=1 Tax=Ooceraea biroi TaxID=2015173 RepID=A0A026W7Z5_OOCBI|nr:THAP domain-containing protein [Ooceraea biroi]
MVVALDDNWKLPIGYFLIDGIDSETSSGLVKTALIKLHEIGVKVLSLTLDGTILPKMKMKVNLAAQTLSQSVADALEFCMNDLKLPEFQGCEATIRFIRSIDILFDFLNSRNPYDQGYKAPLRRENEHIWRPRIEQLLIYSSTLKNENRVLLFQTRRKMGFLGMYSAAQAVIKMCGNYVKPHNSQLRYLLTYKLSQDHLELFFCAIRARGGWCPNPHSSQFSSAYKKLLIHQEIASSNGNVEMQDNTTILTVSSSTQ